ncbi:MAG: flavin reductase family protein, partial [Hyphomicrobiaceae bacterium]
MHFETARNNHGMRHNPLKALVAPRPIGWISTIDDSGICNLAPYSFFNLVSDRPPMVMFSSGGFKDSPRIAGSCGEFVCSLATWDLREKMNITSAEVASDVDEFKLAGLTPAPSVLVAPPRVKESPAALECRHYKTVELPPDPSDGKVHYLVIGHVVGIYIDDAVIRDGMIDTGQLRPVARLGYREYGV